MTLPLAPPAHRASATHLNISEVFGPTIQGEGPNAGRLSSFLRLAGCNLTCSWCDSAYTWDWARFPHREEVHPTPVLDVAQTVASLQGRIIVTGGEPLLQATALAEVLAVCDWMDFDVETNGTRPLGRTEPFWDTIICSPKIIPSADQGPLARRLDPGILADERTHFKFVVQGQADLDAVDDLVAGGAFARARDEGRMWLMPEGITPDTLTERTPFVIEAAVERGMNFTSRLHVYGWHDVRGH